MTRAHPPAWRRFSLARGAVLLFVVGAAAACGDHGEPPAPHVKIMSFNIRWEIPGRDGSNGWAQRREMVYRLLRDPNLDVAGLQEATPAQIADLRTAVPTLAVCDDDPLLNGIAILYRADRFELAEASRRRSAVLLAERIAARPTKDPAFIVGDFNASESEAASRYLRGELRLGTSESPSRTPEIRLRLRAAGHDGDRG